MTALWTVIVLLSVIVAVDSLAVIALARQVGLLHLRSGQHPAPLPRSRPGPPPGSSLRLDVPPGLIGSQHELILYGFIRPECGACASALAIALAEAGCAVLLAVPWARLAGLAVAGGLVGAFLAAMSLALVRGQRIGCGCFGGSADLDTVGLSSVLRAVLLEIIVVTSVLARPAAAPAAGVRVLAAALMLLLVFVLAETARLLPGWPATTASPAGEHA